MSTLRVTRAALFAGLLVSSAALAQESPILISHGKAVTGINRLFGRPLYDFGSPFGAIGFTTLGAWQPGAGEPLPLTASSPPDTILATYVDPAVYHVFGVPPVDPSRLNVPLREVPAVVGFDGSRAPVRDHLAASQQEPSRVAGGGPITLGQWLEAGGTLKIRCTGEGRAEVDLHLYDLIPHGLYTVWAGLGAVAGPNPIALGGIPNVFVADEKGSGRFSRTINFCPMDLRPGEAPLTFVEVVFSENNSLTGAAPELIFAGDPPGVVNTPHVDFLVTGTEIE